MSRTYIDLNKFPELSKVPYNPKKELEISQSAMLRTVWVYYLKMVFKNLPSDIQGDIINQIKGYDGKPLEDVFEGDQITSIPGTDWRHFLLFTSMDTIRSKGSIFYKVDINKYKPEHGRIVCNVMSHFMQKNVGLLEKIHDVTIYNEANEQSLNIGYLVSEFRLD